MPAGYEVRELPDSAQVMIRRQRPNPIRPDEKQLLERIIRRRAPKLMFIVDVEDRSLVVYTSDADPDASIALLRRAFPMDDQAADSMRNHMLARANYSKMMQFALVNAESRWFNLDRWCFRGSIDDWHFLEGDAPLAELAEKYAGHLGRESFFDLM